MKPEYERLLRHTLGAGENTAKKSWGYRNNFCCVNEMNSHVKFFCDMEKIGLVERYYPYDGQLFFCATISGARAIGLGKAALIRAGLLEDSNSKAEIKAAQEMMLDEAAK